LDVVWSCAYKIKLELMHSENFDENENIVTEVN